MLTEPNHAEAAKRDRPARLMERLCRELPKLRAEAMTNDYLEPVFREDTGADGAEGSGAAPVGADGGDAVTAVLQRLDERALRAIHDGWRQVIEDATLRRAEAQYFAQHLFHTTSVCPETGETITRPSPAMLDAEALEALRQTLRSEFQATFDFQNQKRKLAAEVSEKEQRYDSAIKLTDFLQVMWEPMISTSAFDEDGSRRGARRQTRVHSQANKILDILRNGVSRTKVTTGSDLSDFLTDIFVSIDNTQQESITWGQFITFVMERVFRHEMGSSGNGSRSHVRFDSRNASVTANGSLIYRDSFKLDFPAHRQHWIQRVEYYPQGGWDSIVALDGKHAVVTLMEDFDKQQGISDGDAYAEAHHDASNTHGNGNANDDEAYSYHQEQLEERLRVSCAAHFARGVYYFAHRGAVNSCEWISKEKLFLTVATEPKQLRFWTVHNRSDFRFLSHCRLDVPDDSAVTTVRIDEKRLLSADTIKIAFGTRGGYVLCGDIVDADQIKRCHHRFPTVQARLHSDAVTAMLVLPRTQRMVSCGLDGRIVGFSPEMMTTNGGMSGAMGNWMTCEYRGHKRGVLAMAYCSGYEVFISGGFETAARCWAENLPRSPAFLLEDVVQPHQHPICSILAVPRTPNVYTVDTSGVIKVFDVRTLKALGSWGVTDVGRVPNHVLNDLSLGEPAMDSATLELFREDDKSPQDQMQVRQIHKRLVSNACFTGSKYRSIIVGSRGMHRFLTESRNGDADRPLALSDGLIVSLSVGHSTLLTASGNVARVWSQHTGRILATHRTVRYTPSPTTCAAVDDAGLKILTGHANGQINAFHRDTGVVLRRYRFHDGRIHFVALDAHHGVFVSSCSQGQLAFWRDRDAASSHRGRYAHAHSMRGGRGEMDDRVVRRWGPLPDELSPFMEWQKVPPAPADTDPFAPATPDASPSAFSPVASVRRMALTRWAVNRWFTYLSNARMKSLTATASAGGQQQIVSDENLRPVRTPCSFMKVLLPCKAFSMQPQEARIAVLASRTVCRVFDYTVMPPMVTHRLFLGKDRPLLSVALLEGQNVAVVTDIHGMIFLWLMPHRQPAVLLSCVTNKCLVASYSHPHEEFRDVGSEDENELDPTSAGKDEKRQKKKKDEEPAYLQVDTGDMKSYQPPAAAVPAVTCLWLDPVRFCVFSGDDVGFVSVWELDPIFSGWCEVYESLQMSEVSGEPPRWVLAWRAHPLPVLHVQTITHASYAVITLGADNMVSLWTMSGAWIAGLRQGPVVDRTWLYPNQLLDDSSLVQYRFEKLYQAFRTGELARLRRVRDGEEPDRLALSRDLRAALCVDSRVMPQEEVSKQIVKMLDPKSGLKRVEVFRKKRLSVALAPTGSRALVAKEDTQSPSRRGSQIGGPSFDKRLSILKRAHLPKQKLSSFRGVAGGTDDGGGDDDGSVDEGSESMNSSSASSFAPLHRFATKPSHDGDAEQMERLGHHGNRMQLRGGRAGNGMSGSSSATADTPTHQLARLDSHFGSVVEEMGVIEQHYLATAKRRVDGRGRGKLNAEGRPAQWRATAEIWSPLSELDRPPMEQALHSDAPMDPTSMDHNKQMAAVEATVRETHRVVRAQQNHMTVTELKKSRKGTQMVVSDLRTYTERLRDEDTVVSMPHVAEADLEDQTRPVSRIDQLSVRQPRKIGTATRVHKDLDCVRAGLHRAYTPPVEVMRPGSSAAIAGSMCLGGSSSAELRVLKRLPTPDFGSRNGLLQRRDVSPTPPTIAFPTAVPCPSAVPSTMHATVPPRTGTPAQQLLGLLPPRSVPSRLSAGAGGMRQRPFATSTSAETGLLARCVWSSPLPPAGEEPPTAVAVGVPEMETLSRVSTPQLSVPSVSLSRPPSVLLHSLTKDRSRSASPSLLMCQPPPSTGSHLR